MASAATKRVAKCSKPSDQSMTGTETDRFHPLKSTRRLLLQIAIATTLVWNDYLDQRKP